MKIGKNKSLIGLAIVVVLLVGSVYLFLGEAKTEEPADKSASVVATAPGTPLGPIMKEAIHEDSEVPLYQGPTLVTGDDCTDPIVVNLPAQLPYSDLSQTTCGRNNDYDATCLGSYDGGEDIIYQVNVSSAVVVDITMNPKGTSWTGMAIDNACPPGDPCMDYDTGSSGSRTLTGVSLAPGTYYIMIDTWPSPDCIPDFDLTIVVTPAPPANDSCVNAQAVGDTIGLPFSTNQATFDGGGTCMTSPNIWYCYTATCDGYVTVSLCGSGFDTKLAVYDGCECDPLGAEIECNDDCCGAQSQISISFPTQCDHDFVTEVGGYGSATGNGILTISCHTPGPPPANDDCENAIAISPAECPAVTTVYGTTKDATIDCPGVLDWEAVWYVFELTYAYNKVYIDYCPTNDPRVNTRGVVLYDECPTDCPNYILYTGYSWVTCPSGYTDLTLWWENLPAGTYYLPVYVVDCDDNPMDFGFDICVEECLPTVSNYTFEQLNFLDQDGIVVAANSDWGQISFDVVPGVDGVVQYLNISAAIEADTGWIVRNFPVLPDDIIDPGRFALHFDFNELGVSSGTDVTYLEYVTQVTPTIQVSGPLGTMTPAPIEYLDIQRFGSLIPGGDNDYDWPSDLIPPYYTSEVNKDSIRKYKGLLLSKPEPGVPSVQEDDDECASGSTARSLKWLSNKYGLGLGTAQSIQEELDNPEYMNQGVTDEEQIKAKKKYIEDNNLPLEVHYWYSKSVYPTGMTTPGISAESSDSIDLIEWIWREMKKGQDIEITISWASGGGHSVTLVGIDKKNKKIEYRDDETQGNDAEGDSAAKETEMVPLGKCIKDAVTYLTSEEKCTEIGGDWQGLTGDYGFDAHNDWIKTAIAESPKSFDLGWQYHPRYVDGWLTVYGTIDCQIIEPPIFGRTYVESCHTYKGYIPLWANDYIIIFEWDYWCENVDFFKVADPYYDGYYWRLYPLVEWLIANLPADGMILPTIGDEWGEIQNAHVVVNLEEWLADPRPPQDTYDIIDGECDDLPGYLIGTTPITFDSLAGPEENPFGTTPLTGTLVRDGELIFAFDTTGPYICGDCNGDDAVDVIDAVYLINYLFGEFSPPDPWCIGDVNCDGKVDVVDVVYLINYLFGELSPPCSECCELKAKMEEFPDRKIERDFPQIRPVPQKVPKDPGALKRIE